MSTITFGSVETIHVADLTAGDWVEEIPTQQGVRGVHVRSGIRDMREDMGTWTRSGGYRRAPRVPIRSRILMFNDVKVPAVNYPMDFYVAVRRQQAV